MERREEDHLPKISFLDDISSEEEEKEEKEEKEIIVSDEDMKIIREGLDPYPHIPKHKGRIRCCEHCCWLLDHHEVLTKLVLSLAQKEKRKNEHSKKK
jgi:hypothetical protein